MRRPTNTSPSSTTATTHHHSTIAPRGFVSSAACGDLLAVAPDAQRFPGALLGGQSPASCSCLALGLWGAHGTLQVYTGGHEPTPAVSEMLIGAQQVTCTTIHPSIGRQRGARRRSAGLRESQRRTSTAPHHDHHHLSRTGAWHRTHRTSAASNQARRGAYSWRPRLAATGRRPKYVNRRHPYVHRG